MKKPTLIEVFPDKDSNKHLIMMFKLIEFRRTNPLTYIEIKYRDSSYIYNELHHIIPRAYCKKYNFEIDNSDNNTIRLRYAEHILIHVFLRDYFFEKQDFDLAYANVKTINYMCGKNQEYINKVNGKSEEDRNQILEILQQNKEFTSNATKYQFEKMSDLEYQQYCKNRSTSMIKFWKNVSQEWKDNFGKNVSNALKSRSQEEKDSQYYRTLQTRSNWSEEEKQEHFNNASKAQLQVWNEYTEDDYNKRCANISSGTKIAMAKIPKDLRLDQIERAAKTLSENCKKRTPKRKAELHASYGKYHIGSKAMSNNSIHHWRYVSVEEQEIYLQNGYEFGNNSSQWLKQGYVKIGKGRYALP